jgi:hypothetical protein
LLSFDYPKSNQSKKLGARMNPEQQRIKIAEACGWTEVHTSGPMNNLCGIVPNAELMSSQGADEVYCHIPDYLSDLNVIHEAEKVLNR